MRRLLTNLSDESGAVLATTGISAVTLLALVALAVDGGLLHNDRRSAQNAADNAAMAAAWAICEGRDPVSAGLATAAANGHDANAGSTVSVTDLGDGRVDVTVATSRDAEFSRVIGSETLEVGASAVAACAAYRAGAGAIPFGAPPSGFDGGLQKSNPCGEDSGNCGRLYSLRLDGYGDVGIDTVKNIAEGTDRRLTPWHTADPYIDCSSTYGVECNVLPSNTGVSAGQLGDGFLQRLSDVSNADATFSYRGSLYNADSLEDVLGFVPQTLAAHGPPEAWDDGIHGPWATADLTNHYWIDGVIKKCDSPRLASILIATHEMSYDPADYSPGDPYPEAWPNGSQSMKVLEHYYIYIDSPNDADDFQGSGNLKTASSKVLWLDPDTTCEDGSLPGPSATTPPILEVSLDQ